MWRKMIGLEEQTRGEKRAALTGINLFFGALIGANLGSLERLALRDYLLLIIVVSMIVLYLQLAPVARRRGPHLINLALMVGGLFFLLMTDVGAALFEGRERPSPHLFVTICLWLVSVATIEVRPVRDKTVRDKPVRDTIAREAPPPETAPD